MALIVAMSLVATVTHVYEALVFKIKGTLLFLLYINVSFARWYSKIIIHVNYDDFL